MSRSLVRIGIVGCGRAAAELHLPALRRLAGARVVAIADVDRDRLAAVGDRFQIAARSDDWRAVVERRDVDLVAVCVPPGDHAEITLGALDAGKHVLVEKPLTISLQDCDRLIERAQRTDRIVVVGFNMRRHRLVRRARAIVAAGTLGRVSLVSSTFTSDAGRDPRSRRWRAEAGGVLVEIGVHHYDLWRFLLGAEIEEVFAEAPPGGGVATVSARLSGGTLAAAAFSELTGARNEIDLFGGEGQLHLSCYRFDGLEVAAIAERYPGGARTRLRRLGSVILDLPHVPGAIRGGGDFIDSFRVQWAELVAAVRNGRPIGPTLDDGRRALAVGLAALESVSTGRPVACDGVGIAGGSGPAL